MIRRWVVWTLEDACTLTRHRFCPWLAMWSYELDERWGKGVQAGRPQDG